MADSPDVAWEDHFMNKCVPSSGASAMNKPTKSCARTGCRVVLSLSNTMICPKCQQTVCLTHRIPEEHFCPALAATKGGGSNEINKKRLAALAQSSFSQPTNKTKPVRAGTNSKSSGISANSNVTFGVNKIPTKSTSGSGSGAADTSRGTAERRMRVDSAGNSSASAPRPSGDAGSEYNARGETYQCHLCSSRFAEPVMLLAHMDTAHGGTDSSLNSNESGVHGDRIAPPHPPVVREAPRNNAAIPAGNSGRGSVGPEICPQCDHRFHTVDELINHFESAHGETPAVTSRNATGTNRNIGNNRGTSQSGNSGDNCDIS